MNRPKDLILPIFSFFSGLLLVVALNSPASAATTAEIEQWLQAHNNYRSLHGVPNVTWSVTVATSAQTWANTCPSGHSSSGYGENMAFASNVLSISDVVAMWYNEEPLYDYNNPGWNPATGHFTQVVWKNTTEIGCGYVTGCGTGWPNVWVCQYNPPGNVIGQFAANVFPPGLGVSLAEAVDNTSLAWTTGGNGNWYGQSAESYSGGDAARSGSISHSQDSWLQTSIKGPAKLTFFWKVSSETSYDFLRCYINGVEQSGRISGEVGWTQKTHTLLSGTHVVKWVYTKDATQSSGSDAGWIDKVTIQAMEPGGNFSPAIFVPLLFNK